MTVLQPHYITAGRYTPRTDRKLFAGIFDTTSSGAIMTGVLPPTNHFEVTSSGLTVSVSPGFAVIADSSSQSTDSPGVYLCTIDANPETLTLPSTTATYQIYAEVNESQVSITNKVLTSNVATLTTSNAHTFLVGQTVLVTGVDTTFDGSYVITAINTTSISTYNFSYSKTTTNVTSASATGYASVPFAIKSSASAVPTGSNITLAEVIVSSSTITSVNDKRTFVTGRGGVQLYRSLSVANQYTATTAETGPGRISYDLSTGDIKYYDSVSSTTVPIVYHSTGHHDSVATGASADAIHHKIGTGAYDAAAGSHVHSLPSSRLAFSTSSQDGYDGTNKTISSTSSSSPNTLATTTLSIPANSTTYVWVVGSASVSLPGNETVSLGLQSSDDSFNVRGEVRISITPASGTVTTSCVVPATIQQLMTFTNTTSSPVSKTISFKAYRTSGTGTYETTRQTLSVIPFTTTTVNAVT